MEGLEAAPQTFAPKQDIDLADAAVLMAADGYGKGKVVGTVGREYVTIRTSDTQLSFEFSKEPDPQELANVASAHFQRIVENRSMDH